MRICYFCSVASFDTGMPINTFRLIEHFRKRDGYTVFAVFPEEGELSRRVGTLGVTVKIIPFARLRSPLRHGLKFLTGLAALPRAQWRLTHFLKKNKIELIHFSDFLDAPFYPCAPLAGTRAIAHLRWCLESLWQRLLFKTIAALFLSRTICISRAVKKYSGLGEDRMAVIYNPGPDTALFSKNLRPPANAPETKRSVTVTTIAKFVAVKGLDNFIHMAGLVQAKHPDLCRFQIIGDNYPGHERFYESMQALIKRLDLTNSITILGQQPRQEVAAILGRSDIFVHLVRYEEALGGVILEAMTMGLPVVAFDRGGIGECFTNESSGFLVPAGNVTAAAERVALLANDPLLRKRMGEAGSREIAARFPAEGFFKSVDALYQQTAGQI